MSLFSSRDRIGRSIAQASRLWRRAVDLRLQEHGLTEATWLPLLHLARAGAPMRQKELAASLGLDGSTVARLLDSLQSAGLVERREDGEDRRAKTLHLTPQAQALAARVEATSREVRLAVLSGIPDEDLERTVSVLDRICATLAECPEKEPA